MEKKHENLTGNFFSILTIMHGIDSFSAKIQILFNHQKTLYAGLRIFMVPMILEIWMPDYEDSGNKW